MKTSAKEFEVPDYLNSFIAKLVDDPRTQRYEKEFLLEKRPHPTLHGLDEHLIRVATGPSKSQRTSHVKEYRLGLDLEEQPDYDRKFEAVFWDAGGGLDNPSKFSEFGLYFDTHSSNFVTETHIVRAKPWGSIISHDVIVSMQFGYGKNDVVKREIVLRPGRNQGTEEFKALLEKSKHAFDYINTPSRELMYPELKMNRI